MRSMVEGELGGRFGENRLHDAVHVANNVSGTEPHNPDAMLPQIVRSARIADGVISHVVDAAVDFDCELPRGAEEVDDERSQRMLPAEFETAWALAQQLP